jgi:hypothetical protein
MVSNSERTKILEMIESGTITAEEGLTLLNALGETDEQDDDSPLLNEALPATFEQEDIPDELPPAFPHEEAEGHPLAHEISQEESTHFETPAVVLPADPAAPEVKDDIRRWKRWWVIPLWIGAAVTAIGGLLMFWAFSASGFGFWFACAWFPFLLGVGILALAWGSRTAPWLHVRVQQAPGEKPQKIAISFPIPVHLTAWGLRTFGHHIPHMENTNLDEVILALKDVARDETPLFVDVDEGENGERVQVFIG